MAALATFSRLTLASRLASARRLRVVGEDLGEDVRPSHAGQASDEPAGGELGPTLGALHGVAGDVAAREGLDADHLVALERGGAVDGEARGEDDDEAGAGQAARDLGGVGGAEGAELDEGAGEEETVGEANLTAGTSDFNPNTVVTL